ncbi:MAG: hypothetical protein CL573_05000 [Alphaproteobacteria bacterium]|nr:hypothetical protein [Alphaproteobacteria bacterium]HCO99884.1 DUF3253 domain-containing protein [Rhodospirillaceae bacterium]
MDFTAEPSSPNVAAVPEDRTVDLVATAILDQLSAAKLGDSISPEDIARAVAEGRRKANDPPDLWRRYLSTVKQQAIYLARAGKIDVLRKGKPVPDPARAKGVVRYRLAI